MVFICRKDFDDRKQQLIAFYIIFVHGHKIHLFMYYFFFMFASLRGGYNVTMDYDSMVLKLH